MTVECPQCGENFELVGSHWSQSSTCDYPRLTQKQREITVGLLMGDGNVDQKGGYNPRIRSEMASKDYLKYIDSQFGILGVGVSLSSTAEESCKQRQDRGFNAQPENYSDVYIWRSRHHPEFKQFAEWYSSGKKVWPEDIELTPTVLKHWYCGDGSWDDSGSHSRIQIAMSNEVENTQKVDEIFEKSSLPSPSNYNIYDRNDRKKDCTAQFTKEQSEELWKYMGKPLPSFQYKWPKRFRQT